MTITVSFKNISVKDGVVTADIKLQNKVCNKTWRAYLTNDWFLVSKRKIVRNFFGLECAVNDRCELLQKNGLFQDYAYGISNEVLEGMDVVFVSKREYTAYLKGENEDTEREVCFPNEDAWYNNIWEELAAKMLCTKNQYASSLVGTTIVLDSSNMEDLWSYEVS